MIDVGIYEGDILIVEKTKTVKNRDIVVALLDGETTVKRYLKKGDEIFLVPENKTLKPIRINSERFELQGRVVALRRRF